MDESATPTVHDEPLMVDEDEMADRHYGVAWWALTALGAAVIIWALVQAIRQLDAPSAGFWSWLIWMAGSLIVNDAIIVVAVTIVGFILAKFLHGAIWQIVGWALWLIALVLAVYLPAIFPLGGAGFNPSERPLPYGRNFGIFVGVVIVVALARFLFAKGWERHRAGDRRVKHGEPGGG